MPGATTTWPSRLLDLLFEDPVVGRCLVAPDGSVLRANAEWLRSAALSLEDALGARAIDLSPEPRAATLALHARARAGEHVEIPRHERRLRGKQTWWEGSIDPVPMDGGTGLLVTAREVAAAAEGAGEHDPARKAGELLEATLASMTQGVIVYGARGEVLRVNAAAERILGVTQTEASAGLPESRAALAKLQTPDGAPMSAQETPVWKALHGQCSRDVEMVLHKVRTGEPTCVSVSAAPIRGSNGLLCGAVVTFSDVTEHRRAEQAVRRSEERFRRLVEVTSQIVWVTSASGEVLEDSPSWRAFTGRDYAQWAGWKWLDSIHPDDRERLAASWKRAVEMATPYEVEFRQLHASGEYREMESRAVPILSERGEVREWIGMNTDVTKRTRAEQAMRESEELYRSLFTLAPSGVVLNDADGRIVAFNDTAHERLGYDREEFARLRLCDVDAHEKAPDVRDHIARIAAAGGAEYEVQHRTKSGDTRDVLVRTRPVELGGERRFLNVWQDITDRKRDEKALREADQHKTEFLAMLSHELRNPLAPIRNSIYLLERAAPGSEQASRAKQVMRRQTEHLTRLVDDLLDMTRVSRGKIELHSTRLDLREVVHRTADDLRSVFEQSRVTLHLDPVAAPVWVDADFTRIAQVLANLLNNAVKFTPCGGAVTVGITTRAGNAELYVRDTGVGMEPGQIERMFEPFAQADQNLARTKGGLGLGLALVKGLVELHGGRVRARSAGMGRGAEFVVTLPSCSTGAAASPRRGCSATASERLVLVIEDNVDAAQSLAEILEIHGHRARIARGGRSGVELARELRPDVVLCDIGLPDFDGYEVARALRGIEALRSTRLIALSGYAQPEDRQRAHDAGFDAHMAKPPDIDELMTALAAVADAERRVV